MPNYISRGLPNDYREANGYSTEAAYRDVHREVDQERTEAIIRMTFTEKRPTETLPNAEGRDAGIQGTSTKVLAKQKQRVKSTTTIAIGKRTAAIDF
jgi:hypothetical protein